MGRDWYESTSYSDKHLTKLEHQPQLKVQLNSVNHFALVMFGDASLCV